MRKRIVEFTGGVQALTYKYLVKVFEVEREITFPTRTKLEGEEAIFLFESITLAKDFISFLEVESTPLRKLWRELENDKENSYCEHAVRRVETRA